MRFFLLFVIISILLFSCNLDKTPSDNDLDFQTKSIDKIIYDKFELYKFENPLHYNDSGYSEYNRSILLAKKTDSFLTKINNDILVKQDIDDYQAFIYKENYTNSSDIDDISNINPSKLTNKYYKSFTINRIKLLELMILEVLRDRSSRQYFEINRIKPIVSAEANTIKLGDTYKATIFVAGYNSEKHYPVIINGDTINNNGDNSPPIFTEKPTTKGKKSYDCKLLFPRGTDYVMTLDFKIEYEVK